MQSEITLHDVVKQWLPEVGLSCFCYYPNGYEGNGLSYFIVRIPLKEPRRIEVSKIDVKVCCTFHSYRSGCGKTINATDPEFFAKFYDALNTTD